MNKFETDFSTCSFFSNANNQSKYQDAVYSYLDSLSLNKCKQSSSAFTRSVSGPQSPTCEQYFPSANCYSEHSHLVWTNMDDRWCITPWMSPESGCYWVVGRAKRLKWRWLSCHGVVWWVLWLKWLGVDPGKKGK